MPGSPNPLIRYAFGRKTNLGKAKNRTESFTDFKDRFREPLRTDETVARYRKMSQDEQVVLKRANGWFYRTHVEKDRRTRDSGQPSDLITLDLDHATPEFVDDIRAGLVCPHLTWFAHSSRRHTADAPRLRIIIPLAEPLLNTDYEAVSRIVALMFDPGFTMIDGVSFRRAQMMFMPTASVDGDFFFHEENGPILLDWQAEAAAYAVEHGDWHDYRNLPTLPDEHLRERVQKAEDPTTKKGMVGDFCRAYSVPEAIETFLSEVYSPSDDFSSKPRYSYVGGTTANGAVVEDDGLFLYSHHGSDPVGDMLVNAFDLVRIHLFGEQDKEVHGNTKPANLPSWKSMVEMLAGDPLYRQAQVESRYEAAMAFTDDDVEDDDGTGDEDDLDATVAALVGVPAPQVPATFEDGWDPAVAALGYVPLRLRPRKPKPPKDWVSNLALTPGGVIQKTLANVAEILRYDARIRHAFAYNTLSETVVLVEDFDTHISGREPLRVQDRDLGDPWSTTMSTLLRVMLSTSNGDGQAGWGVAASTEEVRDTIELLALESKFNPVLDRIMAKPWDGVPRLETMFIRYLGCEDNAYTRQAAVLFLVAGVTRQFEPGHKFDFVPIIEGEQGIGKSSFADALSLGFFKEITSDLSDEARVVENTLGAVLVEMPELSSMRRSDVESTKAWVTRTESTVRLAYRPAPATYRRRFLVIGTTNQDTFLVDTTGNRRWWPLLATVERIDLAALRAEVQQLWAEALVIYARKRQEQPEGPLPLFLQGEAAEIVKARQHEKEQETEAHQYAGVVKAWLMEPRAEDKFDDSVPRYRDQVCILEVWAEAIGEQRRPGRMDSVHVAQALRMLGWQVGAAVRFPDPYGVQKAFTPHFGQTQVSGLAWVRKQEIEMIDVTPPDSLI